MDDSASFFSIIRRLAGAAMAILLLSPAIIGAEPAPKRVAATVVTSRPIQPDVDPVATPDDSSAITEAAAAPSSDFKRLLSGLLLDRQNFSASDAASRDGANEPQIAAAMSDETVAYLNASAVTASSSLDPERALRLAKLVCAFTPHASYCYILPTGSMKPLFGEKVILLLESAPFQTLQVGDIVTYRHARLDALVVHRLMAKDQERFHSKGDANRREDDCYVTPANYRQRVFGIIYTKSQPE